MPQDLRLSFCTVQSVGLCVKCVYWLVGMVRLAMGALLSENHPILHDI